MKKRFVWWAIFSLAAVLVATALVYRHLPARVPVHWNGAGVIDRYGSPNTVFVQPLIMAVVAVVWLALPSLSPQRFDVESFASTWWFSGMATIALLAYIDAMLLWGLHSGSLHLPNALLGGVCLFIVLIGNVMGKVRRNFWIGVRTPWTLADERVWYATHRFASKTMVAGGLLALCALLAGLPPQAATALLVIGAVVPAGYSLIYYKRLQRS